MAKSKQTLFPILERGLKAMGKRFRLARLRRRFSMQQMCERADISPNTLRAIERGEASASMGAYARVLFCLRLSEDLDLIAKDDDLGRKLQDAQLPTKIRAPRRVKKT
ncbi:MAG TPA: helix-turn-helix domain-containing protein [Coxiellaceae bacterium]|nr:helix-turn-helix domain-containing protein [Coxiellaceae bacterium]